MSMVLDRNFQKLIGKAYSQVKWEAFKNEMRVQRQYVHISVKGKTGSDLDMSIGDMVSKIADDTKITDVVGVDSEVGAIFAVGPIFASCVSSTNITVVSLTTGNGRALVSIAKQSDLGVQAHSSLKVESQVGRVVKKTFGMLAFIGQNIEHR
eukprot:g42231.t1